jgi:hypothetical protein
LLLYRILKFTDRKQLNPFLKFNWAKEQNKILFILFILFRLIPFLSPFSHQLNQKFPSNQIPESETKPFCSGDWECWKKHKMYKGDQNPSLLLNLDFSTYSWMCCWSTAYSTTSRVLKETYLDGSKSAGLWVSGLLVLFHLSISDNCN